MYAVIIYLKGKYEYFSKKVFRVLLANKMHLLDVKFKIIIY